MSIRFRTLAAIGVLATTSLVVVTAVVTGGCVGDGVVGELIDESDPLRFDSADRLTGDDELLRHARSDEARQQLGAAHVGDDAPLDLHERELRVGARHPDVGSERDLHAAAEGGTEDRGDDGDLDERPHVHGLLGERASRAESVPDVDDAGTRLGDPSHLGEIEARAEGPPPTGEDDGPDLGIRREPETDLDEVLTERGPLMGKVQVLPDLRVNGEDGPFGGSAVASNGILHDEVLEAIAARTERD